MPRAQQNFYFYPSAYFLTFTSNMENGREIISKERFSLTIERLAHQLIEHYDDFQDTCLIGIQTRGAFLSDRIYDRLQKITDVSNLHYGKLDITFYRDDFRHRTVPLKPSATIMDFNIEDRKVILVDDVLYTGRTVQAALTALNHWGRPSSVDLLVLVDRQFNRHLPIEAQFKGITVDALNEAYVKVKWSAIDGVDQIILFPDKKSAK